VASRKANTKTTALVAIEASSTSTRSAQPNSPALPAPIADSAVVASTANPAVASSSRLRPRARNGLGRSLRGTAQAVFIAYCTACATPSPPYRAPSTPTSTAVRPPLSSCGVPSWSPTTGSWLSAESITRRCSSGSPASTVPRIVDISSSSGNSETNA
jgi:hypothetical protein